jgi:hypothetical protein
MINDLEQFTINSWIYKKSMRHEETYMFPVTSNNEAEGGLLHDLKIFNSLPDYLIDLVHDKNSL